MLLLKKHLKVIARLLALIMCVISAAMLSFILIRCCRVKVVKMPFKFDAAYSSPMTPDEINYGGNKYGVLLGRIRGQYAYYFEIYNHKRGKKIEDTLWFYEIEGVSPKFAISYGDKYYINEKYLWAYQYKKIIILSILTSASLLYIVIDFSVSHRKKKRLKFDRLKS